jgi:hypothetical protein
LLRGPSREFNPKWLERIEAGRRGARERGFVDMGGWTLFPHDIHKDRKEVDIPMPPDEERSGSIYFMLTVLYEYDETPRKLHFTPTVWRLDWDRPNPLTPPRVCQWTMHDQTLPPD